MTANEYQKLAARTINKDLARWEQEDHALHGMVGEIGEIHSMYQKGFQGHTYPAEHYKKELGQYLLVMVHIQLDSVIMLLHSVMLKTN